MVVVELVEYKLHPGADEDNFLKMQEPVLEYFFENQAGFIEPWEIYKKDEDTYVEIVRWKTLTDAKRAQDEAVKDETCKMYFSFIDLNTVKTEFLREKNVLS